MRKNKNFNSIKAGLPPGSLIYTGELKEDVDISIIDYNPANLIEKRVENIEDSFPFKDSSSVTWVNIIGLHRVDIIDKIGKHFDIHPLVLEDILNVNQRPKVEDFGEYIFIVLKMINSVENSFELNSEQVSIILGNNFVFTFQEKKGDVFDPIRKRIRNEKSRIRNMASDYLTYSIIDAIVDNYFVTLEKIGEKIENIEDIVIYKPDTETVRSIHTMKNDLSIVRKSVWPLREVIAFLEKAESKLIHKESAMYFRDVYEHIIQAIDNLETFRDLVAGMLDIYLSSISNKMNEIMKVLTIIATIFIPLTFITGVYGMNFKYMPELEWKFGYPVVILIMVIVALVMLMYFKRKKWI